MNFIRQHLTHLETTGLIRLTQTHPELEYLFRHALVQDAAYESLLLADRQRLHRSVAETLERLYSDRLDELAWLLGQHFVKAGNHQKALEYFILAGDTDMQSYANVEAISMYSHALEIAAEATATGSQLLHVYIQRGRALELNAQYEQALRNYVDMENCAQELGDQVLELAALMARSTLYVTFTAVHNPDRGEILLKKALVLAQKLDDQVAESKILWNLSNLYLFSSRVSAESVGYAERSLVLARRLNFREQMAYTLNDIGLGYWVTCNVDKAKEALREASDLWVELDNRPMLADSLSTSSIVWAYAGDYEQAVAFAAEAYRISQSINNLWGQSYSRHWVAWAFWELGQPGQAIAAAEESIRLGKQAKFISSQVTVRIVLANILGRLGDIERGLNTIDLALSAGELPLIRGYVLAVLAQLHLLNNNLTKAEAVITEAKSEQNRTGHPMLFKYVILTECELALKLGNYEVVLTLINEMLTEIRQFRVQLLIPQVLYLKGQILLALGQNNSAYNCLQEARSLAETLKSRWMLWQILMALSQLESDPAKAGQLRRQAREIVAYIADQISTEDLRASFLNLPDVQEAMEKP